MSSNALIGAFAQGMWDNLGQPDCLNLLTISGYVLQPDTLGWLNATIGSCYMATGATGMGSLNYDVSPDLGTQELAILGARYEVTYYKHLSMAMMGTNPGNMPVLSVREGDSNISVGNPINVGKEYREMAKDANERLNYLVGSYLSQGTGPRSVDYLNPPVYPVYPYSRPNG